MLRNKYGQFLPHARFIRLEHIRQEVHHLRELTCMPMKRLLTLQQSMRVSNDEGRMMMRFVRTTRMQLTLMSVLLGGCSDPQFAGPAEPVPAESEEASRATADPYERSLGDRLKDLSFPLLRDGDSQQVIGGGRLYQVASATTCDLGSVACGAVDVTQQFSNFLGWASTWKNSPEAVSVTVAGAGTFIQGFNFPVIFELHCATVSANSCSDAESYPHTCGTEYNAMGLATIHTATTSSHLYTAGEAESASCPGADGDGGEGSGGSTCESQTLIIEVWNDGTGMWEYWGTETVLVCT